MNWRDCLTGRDQCRVWYRFVVQCANCGEKPSKRVSMWQLERWCDQHERHHAEEAIATREGSGA